MAKKTSKKNNSNNQKKNHVNQKKQGAQVKDGAKGSNGKIKSVKSEEKKALLSKQIEKKQERAVMDLASNDELKKLGIVVFVLVAIFFVFYGITALVHRNDNNHNFNFDDNTPVEIQYDEILVGGILNQNSDEYYVLLQREDDVYVDLYHYYASKYKAKSDSLKVYVVDVDNVFNKGYVADTSQLVVTNLSEMKIAGTALLHVRGHQIIASYEGEEQIVSKMKELIG